jgi:hypothetical protein
MEGLQYFTGLISITLNNNLISLFPAISNLTKLQELSLSQNHLQYLPDLSHQRSLRILNVDNNSLQVLTDLSQNDSLQYLDVHGNQLDTLPDLGHLAQLTYLNTVSNPLSYLPGIEKLNALRQLIIWKNQLVSLPSLANLSHLIQLDGSQNQLQTVPDLGAKNKMATLFLDRNNISTLPDFSGFDSLQSARLYGNNLTFTELIKLTSKAHYDTIFKISPQKTLLVGERLNLSENETMILSTHIDRGLAGVSYQWFKNGNFLATTTVDSLVVQKVSFQDSGKYTCQIKHPAFQGFALLTDTFFVSVAPCLDLGSLSLSVTGIHCVETGTLSVIGLKPSGSNVTYVLKSNVTGKTQTSQIGIFVGLTESQYALSFQRAPSCEKSYASPILVPIEPCKEAYLTPNNDGDTDSIFFPQTGKVIIYDKRGSIVKTLSIPSEWDGTTKNGLVAQGYYTADINNGQELINISVMY